LVKTWSTPAVREAAFPVPCALCTGADPLQFKPALRCEGFAYVRCRRCGLVQMTPQPGPEAVRRRYAEAYGEDYLAYELAHEDLFLQLQVRTLADLGLWPPPAGAGKILDVGCATGALLQKFRERGWEAAGVEISTPEAEYARSRGLPVYTEPLETLAKNELAAASFDLVLASHVIEHLNDPGAFVEAARRLLAPGGELVITTPNIAGLQSRLFGGRWRSAIFDHLYLFSVKTLSALLESRGFRVEAALTWGGLAAGTAPLPLKRLADALAKRLGLGDVMALRCEAL